MKNLKSVILMSTALVVAFNLSAYAAGVGLIDEQEITVGEYLQPVDAFDKADIQKIATLSDVKISPLFDSKTVQNNPAPASFEPLVVEKDGKITASDTFADNAYANLLANDLSYCLVKGNVQLSDDALEKLNSMGWEKVGMYSALEGKHLNFGDVAGIILYNKVKNMYNIVWHGTASNAEGWQTNSDSALIRASDVSKEVVKTIKSELVSLFRAEKSSKSVFDVINRDIHDELIDVVENERNLGQNFSSEKILAFQSKLQKALISINKKRPGFIKETNSSNGKNLFEKIDDVFQVKIEMLDSIKKNNIGRNYEGKTHRGYTLKVASAMNEINKIIANHARTLTKQDLTNARVMTTGHSMAGGLIKIFAAYFSGSFETIFGQKLEASQNRLLVHALSAAPCGDKQFKDDIERALGQGNIFDQKTDIDIVPKAYLTENMLDWIESLPIVGKELVSLIGERARYADQIGYAAIDDVQEVHNRVAKNFPGDNIVNKGLSFGKAVASIVSDNINPIKFSEDVAADMGNNSGFFANVKAFGKNILKRAANILVSPLIVAGRAVKNAVLHNKLAVPHYGINLGDSQPAGQQYGRTEHFEPALASPVNGKEGYNAMLENGLKIEQRSKEEGQETLDIIDMFN